MSSTVSLSSCGVYFFVIENVSCVGFIHGSFSSTCLPFVVTVCSHSFTIGFSFHGSSDVPVISHFDNLSAVGASFLLVSASSHTHFTIHLSNHLPTFLAAHGRLATQATSITANHIVVRSSIACASSGFSFFF
jgi:hypothetical protein